MRIIIGLGNPGEKYQKTRHNVGFEVLDVVARKLNLDWQEDKKRKAHFAKNQNFLLIKPMSFMNLSGEPIRAIFDYYNVLPKKYKLFSVKDLDLSETVFVVHDDIDIDFGKYKISIDSRSAGHNGVQSIINHLKTKKFVRYRVGVKNNQLGQIPANKFVLQKFSSTELEVISQLIEEIADKIIK